MTISASGFVGIGTSTPSSILDVRTGAGTTGTLLSLQNITGAASENIVPIRFYAGNSFGGLEQIAAIWGTNINAGTNNGGMLIFATSANGTATTPAERFRIANDGASLFRVSSDSVFDTLTLFNTSQTSAGNRLRFQNGYGDLAGIRALQMDNGSLADDGQLELQTAQNASLSTKMTITNAGSIGAPSGTNIYNASDVRLKRNVETITDGLSKVSALRPVKFNWIEGFELTEENKDMFGFIAQEVQNAVPEAVENFGGNSITVRDTVIDNPLRVNEKFIIPVLVKAIQELTARIEQLENK
jgi:hypothetical protein